MSISSKTHTDLTPNARRILERRYLKRDENGQVTEEPDAMFRRAAQNIASADAYYDSNSEALRAGVDLRSISKRLKGIRCASPSWQPGGMILSCADAIGKAMEQYMEEKNGKEFVKADKTDSMIVADICPECPECGNILEYSEGCVICKLCGYSKCW